MLLGTGPPTNVGRALPRSDMVVAPPIIECRVHGGYTVTLRNSTQNCQKIETSRKLAKHGIPSLY